MQFEQINTLHLTLRKITPEVYQFIYENCSDPELMDFLGLQGDAELAKEKGKYAKGLSTHNRSFVNFQLLDIETRKIIGGCGFHTWYTDHSRAEIGYKINDESLKHRGLMTEALNAVVDYGFANMGLNRMEACIGTNNIPSLRLVQKLGFKKEGLLRAHYNNNGTIEDSLIFSLLRSEYKM